jgi:hypothetical protein
LLARIKRLKSAVGGGLIGTQLMAFFLQRCIEPLQSRASMLWSYSGLTDPSRVSVVGMTIRVGQGQSHLLADVPGISTTLGQSGRLRPMGRLHRQPADDSTVGSPSWRRRRNSSNGRFTKRGTTPKRSTEAGDKRDASHAWSPPTNRQEPPPRKDPRQSGGHMPRRCRSKGKGTL